jgi:NAD(P)H-hydrate epimerase
MSQIESPALPRQLFCAASVRELDRIAIEQHGIPGFELMRRAGRAAFNLLHGRWPQARCIAVFCGAGNNGGDGYIVAARAVQLGLDVRLYMLTGAERLQGDARTAYELAVEAGVVPQPWQGAGLGEVDVIVDGLLGTGISGSVREDYRHAIEAINSAAAPVLALDIPSGLCSDTGAVLGAAVVASCTIAFIGLKQGLLTGEGQARCGSLHFSDLAVPESVLRSLEPDAWRLDAADLQELLPPRPRTAHKGHYGHVLVIGGDHGMGGAVALAARAAGRSGAGLVSLATRPEHVSGVMAQAPEVMSHGVNSGQELEPLLQRPSVIVIGPGLGRQPWAEQMLQKAWAAGKPLVVDADALNIISEDKVVQAARRDDWVITPHPGEAARLLGRSVAAVQGDRFAAVRDLQSRYGGAAVLKGSGSLVAAGSGAPALCPYGNPGMASGGMGDVLSGIVGGLLAQGFSAGRSARLAVLLHARAADMAAASGGERGLLASDLLPWIRGLANSR